MLPLYANRICVESNESRKIKKLDIFVVDVCDNYFGIQICEFANCFCVCGFWQMLPK